MKTVGGLLSSLFKEIGIQDRIKLGLLQQQWKQIFSEPLSSHTYPAELNNAELTVNVDSPAWLQQLKFFKKEMSGKLSAYGIKDIKLRHGRIYKIREKQKDNSEPKAKTLSPADRQWIEETVSEINDSALKDQISSAIEKSLS
jgi:hypothetical protein